MTVERLAFAKRHAGLKLEEELPKGSGLDRFREKCLRFVTWVFDGGARPRDELTEPVRRRVNEAVEYGLMQVYGQSYLDELNPDVVVRLASIARR